MSSVKGMSWATMFSDTVRARQGQNEPFDSNKIAKDTTRPLDAIRESIGGRIFEVIKEHQRLIKSKKLSGSMLQDMKQSYSMMVELAKKDVEKLICIQDAATRASMCLFHGVVRECLETKIIPHLDRLILRQAELVRKAAHCSVVVKNSAIVRRELDKYVYDSVSSFINKGEYEESIFFLLLVHSVIEPRLAVKLYALAQKSVEKDPQDLKDLLEFLNLRLFSKMYKTPQHIDYSGLHHNKLYLNILNNPENKDIKNSGSIDLSALLDDFIKVGDSLIESTLRKNYNTMIIKEIDLLGLVSQQQEDEDFASFLKR